MSLRLRLFGSATLILALAIGAAAWAIVAAAERGLDEIETRQRAAARAAVLVRLERLRARAADRVRQAAAQFQEPSSETAWEDLAARHGLDFLEAIDADGRLAGSSVWSAGLGLPANQRTIDETRAVVAQRIASGAGYVDRLAVAGRARTGGALPLALMGGYFLDGEALADLPELLAADVAFAVDATGRLSIDVRPRGEAGFSRAALRRSAIGAALAALVVGALLSALIADGIAARLGRLARAAATMTAGDRSARLPEEGGDEIADLGRALNEMAADFRTSEARLAQAGRVAVWRDLARRLAHELKNPLFPIQLSVETLRRAYEREGVAGKSDGFAKMFDELTRTLLQEVGALKRIVQDFSEFGRLPVPQLRPTDLNQVLGAVLDLHAPRAPAVRIERGFDPSLPPVPADADLLSRALTNLVGNALEAMPEAGTLRATTRVRGRHAELAIADTGAGFSEEQKALLFRPYHTTKPGGTGLGLVIVQSVAADHGGFVEADGAPGAGAVFRILLPLHAAS